MELYRNDVSPMVAKTKFKLFDLPTVSLKAESLFRGSFVTSMLIKQQLITMNVI